MEPVEAAQLFLADNGLDGWLLADFRGHNPVLGELLKCDLATTRRVFLFIPPLGQPQLLAHKVDASQFAASHIEIYPYASHADLQAALFALLERASKVAMEYSPQGRLPMVSWVDAGTLELVRSLGVEVVSSADLVQFVLARWDETALQAHLRAARKVGRIVHDAFAYIAHNYPTEFDTAQFIQRRFAQEGLRTDDGPIVAANEHSSNPHHQPLASDLRPIGPGDWVLVDLWAQEKGGPYADVTWVGYWGAHPPAPQQERFTLVARARDLALEFLRQASATGLQVQGWQVDAVVRDYLSASPYGQYFTHRLGHSLGHRAHGFGVNLDNYETVDTRPLIPQIGFTVEPGLYLPDFGIRLEVDVYLGEDGPRVTTPVQEEIVLIGERGR